MSEEIKNRKSTVGYGFIGFCYEGVEDIKPACVMGDGSIGVIACYNPDNNLVGVQFSSLPTAISVGEKFSTNVSPNKTQEFALYFDNPKSIDVVISKLEEAKRSLLNPDWED